MSDPWRTRCPNGHTSVTLRVGGPQSSREEPAYTCKHCGDVPYVVDVKTGEQKVP